MPVLEKLKVSIIEPVGGHGGLEFYDLGLCEAVCSQQVDTTLYTCDKLKINDIYKHNCRIVFSYTNTFSHKSKLLKGIKFFKGTIWALIDSKKRGSSIAHFHIFHFAYREFINILLFKIFGFNIVATIHDVENLDSLKKKQKRSKYKKFSKSIDHVIVHNQTVKTELTDKLSIFKSADVRVIPTTDLDFIYNRNVSRVEARKALDLNIPKNAKVILFFGQIKKTKGLDILIKAFAGLSQENTFLLIAGRCWKTDMKEYENLIDEHNIRDKIIFHIKYIESSDVVLYFKASDIVVLPYEKIYNSGILLRSMEYGSATIASDLDMFKHVIREGDTGLIFKSGDYQNLCSVLSEALNDDDLIKKIEKGAVRFITQNYSFELSGAETKKVYQKVLEVKKKN